MNTEKFKIFNDYAKEWKFEDWDDLVLTVLNSKHPLDGIVNHTLAACDKVQEAQQKKIFGNVVREYPNIDVSIIEKKTI